jgi:2-polyprenyl-3-methyl-5-hydroxy-6-metoxy-1,4-benzoquinol methylase
MRKEKGSRCPTNDAHVSPQIRQQMHILGEAVLNREVFKMNDGTQASTHYDAAYFDWEKNISEFGGWASANTFKKSIKSNDIVIDFGCGGGHLLHNMSCGTRIGIEPNPSAVDSIEKLGISHFFNSADALRELGSGAADVIISNHALEHTLNPLQEIKNLRPLLKDGGIIHFVVPCETISCEYNPSDINHHLFTWSPLNLGNLFTEAGYRVEYSTPFIHKWPPHYRKISALGWPLFNLACRIYGQFERSSFQVELRAMAPAN